ncbi:ATP-binding protein [Paenibacillus terrae]|uniref:ORC1/DEAH AAA+ ATPase domain-containing protein n=1 Tax=Paenibacillus terrae (strain HPL-003) TaxID=985665 RepID=G7W1J2_PAETH|nr:ATP-binding protein [Paenibacillus terrae]AET57996.1 hypothetical protein HPL003_06165 [Paenibacillus terrae HPL-003]
MLVLKSYEVFIPGAFPTYTYVSRNTPDTSYSYEFRLAQSLKTIGYLTSIIGPSKTGKTVLCEKVIGQDKIVDLTGNDFKHSEDFWVTVAKKVGLSLESNHTERRGIEGEGTTGLIEKKSTAITESFRSGKDKIIQYFNENNLVLVLDDFHYAPGDMQLEMAYQLKDAIRKQFRTIVISLPHRADDAIRKNPDLSGRLNLINIEPWQLDELSEIATTGFQSLGMNIDLDYAKDIALESLASPQLMQSICLNLAIQLDVDHNRENAQITSKIQLEEAYKMTTINLSYKDVVRKLKAGPNPRGQQRKTYKLVTGEDADIYELLIKAISLNPPEISISIDDMKKRIDELISDGNDKPDKPKVKSAIEQVQSIMQNSESIYQVFEYKDEKIHILEPHFLFYLRWGIH